MFTWNTINKKTGEIVTRDQTYDESIEDTHSRNLERFRDGYDKGLRLRDLSNVQVFTFNCEYHELTLTR